MRIVFLSTENVKNVGSWSGTGHYIYKTLDTLGFEIELMDRLQWPFTIIKKIKTRFYKSIKKRYLFEREPFVQKSFGRQIDQFLRGKEFDAIFSIGSLPLPFIKSKKPIFFWTDATFANMINFYPEYFSLCKETITNGNLLEQKALQKSSLAIYASQWAADSAINFYGTNPDKVKVIPLGANIECNRTMSDIQCFLNNKSKKNCDLLFIGVDWVRKGGDIAVETSKILNDSGLSTTLHVVGCEPPASINYPFIKKYGYISKSSPEGREKLDKLFQQSHFLILPTQAECYGIVFAEASSFGLPSLAPDVGGVSAVIHSGKNGNTFPKNSIASEYASYILEIFNSENRYQSLSVSSFKEFQKHFFWPSIGQTVKAVLCEHISNVK